MEHFIDQFADQWNVENGPFKMLHRMNVLRLKYILKAAFYLKERKELKSAMRGLDVPEECCLSHYLKWDLT